MKFSSLLSLVLFVSLSTSVAHAHDFWVAGQGEAGGEVTTQLGFGHSFPTIEEIKDKPRERFKDLRLIGASGEVPLAIKSSNTSVSKDKVSAGVYHVLLESHRILATRTPEGWQNKYKNEVQGAERCNESYMFAKTTLFLNDDNLDFIMTPQGHKLEVVPQAHPGKVKVGEALPLLILFDGQPLPWGNISATFAGFSKGDANAQAFASKSNKEGKVNFVPLAPGEWKITVKHEMAYPDQNMCDNLNHTASFTLTVL